MAEMGKSEASEAANATVSTTNADDLIDRIGGANPYLEFVLSHPLAPLLSHTDPLPCSKSRELMLTRALAALIGCPRVCSA